MTDPATSQSSTDTGTGEETVAGDAAGLSGREAAAQAATMAAALLRPGVGDNAGEGSFAPASPGAPRPRAATSDSAAPARSPEAPQPSRGGRFTSYDVQDFAVPTGREEDWRFTPLERLRGLHDGSAPPDGKVFLEVAVAPGVVAEAVGRGDPRLGRTGAPGDRVSAQAWSSFDRATVLTVPAEVVTTEATVVSLRGDGGSAASYGHLLVDMGTFAQATVVLDYAGSATYADNVEVRVGDGARLTLVSVYGWDDDAVHLSTSSITVGRDASCRNVVASLGGGVVRIAPSVSYTAPGGDVELLGLYFADAGQHLEHRLFVDHSVPNCRSDVVYKGALQGRPDGPEARTVWIGDVLIRAEAEGTDTYELNRNLVLTDGARADSVPNLEIETGEIVGAGHASATGRFDEEQLFYLRARGIPEQEARRLVVRGFFAELIARIGLPDLEERLLRDIDTELAQGTA